jgi:hypothetical protein
MGRASVQGKREAAKRWSNYVSADPKVDTTWRYILASASDNQNCKGLVGRLRTLAA